MQFRENAISQFLLKYRGGHPTRSRPFILDRDGLVVAHPDLPHGSALLDRSGLARQILTAKNGELYFTENGVRTWVIFLLMSLFSGIIAVWMFQREVVIPMREVNRKLQDAIETATAMAAQAAQANISKSSFLASVSHELRTPMNDILEYSKMEAGKLRFDMLDFDLEGLLDEVSASMALRAHHSGGSAQRGDTHDHSHRSRQRPGYP